MLPAGRPPAWVRPGARYDLDFANGRYWGGSVSLTGLAKPDTLVGMDNGPGDTGYAPDSQGVLHSFSGYGVRITPGCGLWAENKPARYTMYNRDFSNGAWVATSVTGVRNQIGATGSANSGSLVTATAANGTILQVYSIGSTKNVVSSAYVKRVTGSGAVYMTQDGTTWTQIDGLLNTSGYTMVQIPYQSLATLSMGFRLAISGDAIAVDLFQSENGLYPTTPNGSSSSVGDNGNDEPAFGTPGGSYPNAGYAIIKNIFISGGPWSFVGSYVGNPPGGTGAGVIMASDGTVQISGGTDGSHAVFQNATTTNTGTSSPFYATGLPTNANFNKIAGRVSGANSAVSLNGGPISTGSNGPSPPSTNFTHCGLGTNGTGNLANNGYTQRLTFWNKEIPDGQLIEFSRLVNGQ